MIRAMLDTNVILDALFAREQFGEQAARVWKAHEDERFTGYLCAITSINVFYTRHGHKLRFLPSGKAQFVTAGIIYCPKRNSTQASITHDDGIYAKTDLIY